MSKGKTITAYKLLRERKRGDLGPLFINCKQIIPIGEWVEAECHPTKGFAVRPGWHCSISPEAPHLSMKDRAWYEVEISDFYEFKRPERQGGMWFIANNMKVVKRVEE